MNSKFDTIVLNTRQGEDDHSVFSVDPWGMRADIVTLGVFHAPKSDALPHRYQNLLNCRYQFADPSSTT